MIKERQAEEALAKLEVPNDSALGTQLTQIAQIIADLKRPDVAGAVYFCGYLRICVQKY